MGGMFLCGCCQNSKHSDDGYNICKNCDGEICEACMIDHDNDMICESCSNTRDEQLKYRAQHASLQFLNELRIVDDLEGLR